MKVDYSNSLRIRQFSDPNRPFVVKGITIHNTNNELSARDLYKQLVYSRYNNSCHFIVDENEVIQLVPLDKCSFHTGKGYDFGNLFTISIEIARSQNAKSMYLKAQKRACELIAQLMKEYNLTTNDIYFHKDFNNIIQCPHKIIELYETKENFIRKELMQWL